MLGKIVRSDSHVEYVCQLARPGEVDEPPEPETYAFGAFVRAPLADGWAIGVVYDTMLFNPDFGALGPRLTSGDELGVLAPDQLPETATLLRVLLLGTLSAGGVATHGVGGAALNVGDPFEAIDRDQFQAFHLQSDRLRAGYLPFVLDRGHPLSGELALALTRRLGDEFPDHAAAVAVLREAIVWRTRVESIR